MNEKVLIEEVTDEEVSVVPYDEDNKMVVGSSIEVLSCKEAMNRYDVVGEIVNGEVRLYGGSVEYIDSYEDWYGED